MSLTNPSKSTLDHDAVAAAVSHKYNLIIPVGAGLLKFVHGSHSNRGNEGSLHEKFYFRHLFARVFFLHKKSINLVVFLETVFVRVQ